MEGSAGAAERWGGGHLRGLQIPMSDLRGGWGLLGVGGILGALWGFFSCQRAEVVF